MFYREEITDKLESAEDEKYLADHDRHSKAFDKFREKFHRAKNREDSQKLVKKALKIK